MKDLKQMIDPKNERKWMERALQLAVKGMGRTSPNPMVGAVLVDSRGEIVGEGWHEKAGNAHAEVNAIQDAKNGGFSTQGTTLYVTLEPCSSWGRTPPCVDAILKAGIRRVVSAAVDPNPHHQGHGLDLLREAGVEISQGLLAKEAMQLNRAFNHWILYKTPLVTLKSAMSLDGKIATASGESRWITNTDARAHAMQFRACVDAIATGINTVLADNCSLTVRSISGFNVTQSNGDTSHLRRIILDSQARTPLNSNVISDQWHSLTTLVTTPAAPRERVAALAKQVQVWELEPDDTGHPQLKQLLEQLGAESVTHLLIEAGGTLGEAFLRQRLVQRLHFYYAPKVIGGRKAPSGIGGQGANHLSEAVEIKNIQLQHLGNDFLLTGDAAYPEH